MTMNAANLSKTHNTRREIFHRPSSELGTMIKQLIQTPEKYHVYNPDALMKMDLIPTPPSIKKINHETTVVPAPSSMIAKMSMRDRMVCHQDFPQLLHLLHQVKTGCVCSNEYNETTVKLMKDQSKLSNFVIYRGQCSFTDYQMVYYRSMLLNRLKMRARTRTTNQSRGSSRSPVLSPIEERGRGKMMSTSDLIDWAETYVKTSAKPMKKQQPQAQEKKRCGSKLAAMKKTMKQTSKMPNKKSKTAPGPFQDFSSLKLDAHSHISQAIATSSKATIASDVAITMTPHPFKKSKTYGSPPSRIITKRPEVLSDITTRSGKCASRNVAGEHVAAPRGIEFGSPSSTSPIAKFSLSKIKEESIVDSNETSSVIMKENHTPPVKKPSKTITEPANPSSEANNKKESENTGIQVPRILSFSFA